MKTVRLTKLKAGFVEPGDNPVIGEEVGMRKDSMPLLAMVTFLCCYFV